MNIYEEYESSELSEEKKKSKKTMQILAIAIVALFLMSMFMVYYISYVRNKQLKVFVNDAKIKITSGMFTFDEQNENIYVSINDIADKIGYTMNNGEYKNPYSEDITKCYLSNKYETASYIVGSNEIYKAIIPGAKQPEVDYEYFTIDKPVFTEDNKLYTTLNGLGKGCNLSYSYDESKNTIKIYTLDYLTQSISAKVAGTEKLIKQDDLNTYKNKKAILYDRVVVESTDGKFGVNTLKNETIIGQKYKSITFMEELQEFMVETENGLFGIITNKGETKIQPQYASIKQIDKDKGFYLVSKDTDLGVGKERYGIVNKNDRVVIYTEYEKIGIDKSTFPADGIDNPYVLYGKCIPVKKSNKWGLLDINGNVILPIEYDNLGCKTNSSQSSQASSLLLVPEYEAVVVEKDKQYGLYNSSGRELIPVPANVTDMYGILTSGSKQYYLTYLGNTMDIINYLSNTLGIKPINESSDNKQ